MGEMPSADSPKSSSSSASLTQSAINFSKQAGKLAHENSTNGEGKSDVAVEAHFVTPQDPVIVTSSGHRLPGVPLNEAHKLNFLKEELEDGPHVVPIRGDPQTEASGTAANDTNGDGLYDDNARASNDSPAITLPTQQNGRSMQKLQEEEGPLRRQMPPSHTNPLFPPLPLYGPPSRMRNLQCYIFRLTSFFLSLAFLGVIVLGSLFTSIPLVAKKIFYRLTLRNIDKDRPFYEEEMRRKKVRKDMAKAWKPGKGSGRLVTDSEGALTDFIPTEGGPDPVICDPGYYARRVGLDLEEFAVETEDGFIIELWHIYDPKEYVRRSEDERENLGPHVFPNESRRKLKNPEEKPKFPVLLMPGLLQSAGSYLSNDDESLAFYLCKSGYDVWLGNNRCGFHPRHKILKKSDPRMWCWNIRQMGVFDLPALASRVLYETDFEKLGLICHSQGTTQTFVALAKEQRPDLGEKLTVFCALAPAVYAGPLIGKMYFKFMRIITPGMFRLMFGLHAFIGFMMTMHATLPPRLYGWLGYKVFSFLFDWSDTRWDRGLRDRMFRFAPIYVSAESMRWWLGRECFARHKCVLATKEAVRAEEKEDHAGTGEHSLGADEANVDGQPGEQSANEHLRKPRGATAWYDSRAPPFALWVAGSDDLVDGRKLLRRFESGREPYVKVVHSKIIPEYEHLDVIWAMDAPDQIFSEVREVLWKTCHARDVCRTPIGCDDVKPWHPEKGMPQEEAEEQTSSSDFSM